MQLMKELISEMDKTVSSTSEEDKMQHFNGVVATMIRKLDGMSSFLGKDTPFKKLCVDELACSSESFDEIAEKLDELTQLIANMHAAVETTRPKTGA
jgi:hypothetical protein